MSKKLEEGGNVYSQLSKLALATIQAEQEVKDMKEQVARLEYQMKQLEQKLKEANDGEDTVSNDLIDMKSNNRRIPFTSASKKRLSQLI
jgi:phage shock protein A